MPPPFKVPPLEHALIIDEDDAICALLLNIIKVQKYNYNKYMNIATAKEVIKLHQNCKNADCEKIFVMVANSRKEEMGL